MSGGPPPKEVVGFFKVLHKSTSHAQTVTVTLAGENGTCIFRVSEEDANYFVEGEQYLISATKPGS